MRNLLFLSLVLASFTINAEVPSCKILKSCAEWATNKTGNTYILGKYEKRELKVERDFDLSVGDPDFLFNYLLLQSEYGRIKREGSTFEIVSLRDLKDYKFPFIKDEELKASLDFYTYEVQFSNKEKTKLGMSILKKFLSKNGRILEVTDAPKLQIVDTAASLLVIRQFAQDLNK